MKKLKFIYLVLLSFGLILLTYSAEVNAAKSWRIGWEYYEESPFSVPPTNDFEVDTWVSDGPNGVEGHWNFVIFFELEDKVSLEELKVDIVDNLIIELYLEAYEGDGYDDWLEIDAFDYFDEMDVDCYMTLFTYTDDFGIDVSDVAYELLETGYEFRGMHSLYPIENVVYGIEFVFEIDFHIDLTGLVYDEITDVHHRYQIDLHYNSSVYYEAYEKGFDDGYDEGYDDGYYDGILESDVAEAYLQGYQDGEKSKLAENNESFYNGIEKWLVPAIITVIILGGFVTIAVNKRREQ